MVTDRQMVARLLAWFEALPHMDRVRLLERLGLLDKLAATGEERRIVAEDPPDDRRRSGY